MKSRSRVVAAMLAGFSVFTWAQGEAGPVLASTSPPTIYSSSRASTAERPALAAGVRTAPRPATFAAGSVATVAPLSSDRREERRFLRDAAAESRFELDASKLALARSGNIAVRTLAASLINHNNTASLELAHLLNARGMALPMLGNDQRRALNRLAKMNGKRLDAAYIQRVGLGQAGVARDYEKASVAIREPQINAWIVKALPTTRYHLMLAERAAPADPRAAKWNRPRPGLVAASRMVVVQPVAATRENRFSASGSR